MDRVKVPALDEILNKPLQVLDKGEIRLIEYMGTDSTIASAARVSYGKGTKSTRDDQALISYLLKHRHTSPFEMCEMLIYVKLPIFVAAQWIRHRTANINSYSARYSKMEDEFYIPSTDQIKDQDTTNKQGSGDCLPPEIAAKVCQDIAEHSKQSYALYENLIEKGVSREHARMILPQNIYTQWYWKIDLHNLLHFLALRADPHAQYEIREYARVILSEIVAKWVPDTYHAFCKYRLNAQTISELGLSVIKDHVKGKVKKREDYQYTDGSIIGKAEWKSLVELLELS